MKSRRNHHHCSASRDEAGFTRTDLVAVIAMIGILVIALLPAFASDQSSSQTFQCLNNLRQLTAAWVMYSSDNSERITTTAGLGSPQATIPIADSFKPGGVNAKWVLGRVDQGPTDTNPDFVRYGLLFDYVNDLRVYKCPADRKVGANGLPTVRSVSMNGWMNPFSTENLLSPNYIIYRKQTDIVSPDNTWVIIEENPISINDGWFLERPNVPHVWYDIPAAYHRGAAVLSYADSHVEVRRWTDRGLLAQRSFAPGTLRRDGFSDDLSWLLERTTSLK